MSIKKLVVQLEKHIHATFPEYQVKFYSNWRNFYIHMGLDKSLFGELQKTFRGSWLFFEWTLME